MRYKPLTIILIALLAVSVGPNTQTVYPQVQPSIVYVDADNAGGSGTVDDPYEWISTGIAAVASGGTVIVAPGTYVETLTIIDDITFLPTGFRKEQVTPVDLLITRDGALAYVALGRANHVAVVDVKARKVIEYILVGKRAWGLALTHDERRLYVANGLSDDISIIDTKTRRVLKSIPVGLIPYGILIDD